MAYTTQQALIDRFGSTEIEQLTDRINGTVIDTVVVSQAIADADAEIDGYLAARYSLPLASIPEVLARIAADIARYRLWSDRATEAVRLRYTDAVRDLKAISLGSIVIDGVAPLPAAASSMTVKVSAPPRLFSADALARY